MIDLIGKRRYGYSSAAASSSSACSSSRPHSSRMATSGLQFSIAYTGGTVWEVHFEEGAPDPGDVRAVLEGQGLTGEVAITEASDREFVLIRTETLLQETALAEGSAAAAACGRSGRPPTPPPRPPRLRLVSPTPPKPLPTPTAAAPEADAAPAAETEAPAAEA